MDLVVSGISDLKERMVKLEDLPAQVKQGFKDVGGQISSFRKMVLQVGTSYSCSIQYKCLAK